jgi:endonuclease-3 related protein
MNIRTELVGIHERMERHFGDLHWWPADSPFEVMVGAILTQNTAWANVEKAINNLKNRGLLSTDQILRLPAAELTELIRPSGYFRLKTARLTAFVKFFVKNYSGSVEEMQKETLPVLRDKLRGVWGVGPETADSILLYACEKPVFVIDAYTRRILLRHRLISEGVSYDAIQALFLENLPHEVPLFKQYHALIVNTAKHFCRKIPNCSGCPLDCQG